MICHCLLICMCHARGFTSSLSSHGLRHKHLHGSLAFASVETGRSSTNTAQDNAVGPISNAHNYNQRSRWGKSLTQAKASLSIPEPPAPLPLTGGKKEADATNRQGNIDMMELVKFTLPLLCIWLSSPVMSLIDTSVVGARSSVQLAALGPATSLCDNLGYFFTFLASVTTGLAATARANNDVKGAEEAANTGIVLSTMLGVGVTGLLIWQAKALLLFFLGGGAANVAEVLPHSMIYARIRALGFPAVTLTMVLQGTCLAGKDIKTPLRACAASAIANLVGDVFLVFGLGWGIAGAATATLLAQVMGVLYLLAEVTRRSSTPVTFPTVQRMKEFIALGLPVALAIIGQSATTLFTTVAASGCATVSLAAHQVIYGIFLLFCPIGDAISQTVQAYLPGVLSRTPEPVQSKVVTVSKARIVRLNLNTASINMLKAIGGVTICLSLLDALLAYGLPTDLPFLFSPDLGVQANMKAIAPINACVLTVHAISMVLQGVMLAQRDAKALASIYAVCSIVFSTLFMALRKSPALELKKVWYLFYTYQITRAVLFTLRVGIRNRVALYRHFVKRKADAKIVRRL